MYVLIYGFTRYVIIYAVFFCFYVLHGGHIHVIWQPVIFGMQAGFNIICVWFFAGTLKPKTLQDRQNFYQAGKAALVLSLTMPFLAGLIHTMGLLSAGDEVIGHSIGASFVGLLNAPVIFYSFFKWADPKLDRQQADFAKTKFEEAISTRKIFKNSILCVKWFCTTIGALCIAIIIFTVTTESFKEPYYSPYDIGYPSYSVASSTGYTLYQLQARADHCESYAIEDRNEEARKLASRQVRLMEANGVKPSDFDPDYSRQSQ